MAPQNRRRWAMAIGQHNPQTGTQYAERTGTSTAYAEASTVSTVFMGSASGGMVALGAVVLSIVGLAGVFPTILLGIATIAIGAGLLLKGGAASARLPRLMRETVETSTFQRAELDTGIAVETLGGLAGIVLGILALSLVAPVTLSAVAAVIFGGSLVLGSGMDFRLNTLEVAGRMGESTRQWDRKTVARAAYLQMVAGLAAIALGIIALSGFLPLSLTLVAMLSVSGAYFLTNAALTRRLRTAAHR
jgi:hypothetical protein